MDTISFAATIKREGTECANPRQENICCVLLCSHQIDILLYRMHMSVRMKSFSDYGSENQELSTS